MVAVFGAACRSGEVLICNNVYVAFRNDAAL